MLSLNRFGLPFLFFSLPLFFNVEVSAYIPLSINEPETDYSFSLVCLSLRRREDREYHLALEASQQQPPSHVPPFSSTASSRPASAAGALDLSYRSSARPFTYDPSYMANSVDSPSGTDDTVRGELKNGLSHWSGPPGHPRPTLGELDSSLDSQKGGQQSSSSRGRPTFREEEEDDDEEVVPASDEEEQDSESTFRIRIQLGSWEQVWRWTGDGRTRAWGER